MPLAAKCAVVHEIHQMGDASPIQEGLHSAQTDSTAGRTRSQDHLLSPMTAVHQMGRDARDAARSPDLCNDRKGEQIIMNPRRSTVLAMAALYGGLGTFVAANAQNADSQIISFDAPGAGTAPGQGTGCFGCTFAINERGAIVGTYLDANNVYHGFIRSPQGEYTTINAPPSCADTEITGSYWDANYVQHGFVRTPEGSFVTIDPSGSMGTQPESINDLGAITGYYVDANGVYHAFIRPGY